MSNRDTDALVAEKVMGLRPIKNDDSMIFTIHRDWVDIGDYYYELPGSSAVDEVPHYSTDIRAAWEVIESMTKRGLWCEMRTPFGADDLDDGYWAGFTPYGTSGWNGIPDHWTSATTLAEAICLAALQVAATHPAGGG